MDETRTTEAEAPRQELARETNPKPTALEERWRAARAEAARAAEAEAPVAPLIELARDPNVSLDKLQRLIEMQERVAANRAKSAFDAAFAAMQGDLPIVSELGRTDKGKYARLEDIVRAVRPALAKHGFSLAFTTEWPGEGRIEIVGMLTHRDGHMRTSRFVGNADKSGSKNEIQAQGSTVSYGRRYTTLDLLGIATEDDDGARAGKPQARTPPPAGYEEWLTDLEAVADEGLPALNEAWKKSREEFRLYLREANVQQWDAIKVKAQKHTKGGQR